MIIVLFWIAVSCFILSMIAVALNFKKNGGFKADISNSEEFQKECGKFILWHILFSTISLMSMLFAIISGIVWQVRMILAV